MERLSEKLTDVLRECIDALSQVEEDIIKMALNRLAAYEDTGLEPEDFKKAFNEGALLKMPPNILAQLLIASMNGRKRNRRDGETNG